MFPCENKKTLIFRGIFLFCAGVLFSLVLHLLQLQRQSNFFPYSSFLRHSPFNLSSCFTTIVCGVTSATVGLLYPLFDWLCGEEGKKQEWSRVMKCLAVFIGINHASAKIDFTSNFQLFITLIALSLGLWYLFDRSKGGLLIGFLVATVATATTQLLVYSNIYNNPQTDSIYLKSWLPFLFFSGGITVASIGRQLAQYDIIEFNRKEHVD